MTMYKAHLKPNDIPAKLTIIVMSVLVTTYLLSIMSAWLYLSSDEDLYTEGKHPYVVIFDVSTLLARFVYVGGIVVFLIWFSRAYHNLQRLGKPVNHAVYWSVLGWAIPIMWWIRPFEIYGEMVEGYASVTKEFPSHTKKNTPGRDGLMIAGGFWWATYVVFSILAFIIDYYNGHYVSNFWDVFPTIVMVIPGLLLINVVWRFARLEAVVYGIYVSGEYAALMEAREAARAERLIRPENGTVTARWYKSAAANEKSLNQNEDPFAK